MGRRQKLKNGGEFDVVAKNWRKILCYTQRPGVCKNIKRQMNKRTRKESKMKLREREIN